MRTAWQNVALIVSAVVVGAFTIGAFRLPSSGAPEPSALSSTPGITSVVVPPSQDNHPMVTTKLPKHHPSPHHKAKHHKAKHHKRAAPPPYTPPTYTPVYTPPPPAPSPTLATVPGGGQTQIPVPGGHQH